MGETFNIKCQKKKEIKIANLKLKHRLFMKLSAKQGKRLIPSAKKGILLTL